MKIRDFRIIDGSTLFRIIVIILLVKILAAVNLFNDQLYDALWDDDILNEEGTWYVLDEA